jgi:MoxR-like ATPase
MALHQTAAKLPIDAEVQAIILRARREFAARQIRVSDRRWKKMLGILRVAAAAIGRPSVDRSLILLLQHMAWERPEQRPELRDLAISLAISGGESVDQLLGEVKDLHSFLSKTGYGTLPSSIRCYDCDERILSFERLSGHRKLCPTHKYYDPYRTSLHLRIMGFDRLLQVLNEEYGWDCVEILPEQVSKCQAEYTSLRKRYRDLGSQVILGRERLKEQLQGNLWIPWQDIVDVLDRYEAQVRLIMQMGKMLDNTAIAIEQMSRAP